MAVVRPEMREDPDPLMFSQGASCPNCGASVETLEPRSFSFNSPFGACPACDGLGTTLEVDPARVIPDPSKSIAEGAIAAWGDAQGTWVGGTLRSLARKFDFSLKTPWKKLPARVQRLLLHGSGDEKVRFEYRTSKGSAFIQHGLLRRHPAEPQAPLPRDRKRSGATLDRCTDDPGAVRRLRRTTAQARESGGAAGRKAHLGLDRAAGA